MKNRGLIWEWLVERLLIVMSKMLITYNKLLENTAKHMLISDNPVIFSNGKFDTKLKKQALKEQVKQLKKAYEKDPEKKRCVLDQCRFGKERAFRLHLLRRKY